MGIIRFSFLPLRTLAFAGLALLAPQVWAQAVVSAATGNGLTLFIKADGTLWGMGNNQDGQLGDGTRLYRTTPQLVTGGVAAVAAGYRHSAFVKLDGTLWTAGYGYDGQLGFGGVGYQIPPAQVATGVASVAVGYNSTFFVKTDGTLWATGENYAGQLGDGSTSNRLAPLQVASGVASVHAGQGFTLFVKNDGTLWGMGENGRGQLGDGTTTNRLLPIQIATGVATASAGGGHFVFRKADGSMWAGGVNDYGQLGDGTKTSRLLPVQVATGVSALSAGGEHTLFIKTDGSLWAMGNNNVGRLGDGGETMALVPVKIATGAMAVWAGGFHSVFVKQDGTLWGFGNNGYGELGSAPTGARVPTNASQIVPAPTGMGVTVGLSSGALVFSEGANVPSPIVVVDPGLTITSTTPTLVSAKVALSGNGNGPADEELAFTPNPATMGNITGDYDRSLVTWTLRSADGAATIAQWQAALRSITYSNVSQEPTVTDRGVDFVVHNGVTTNPVATRAVTFVAANDSPTAIFLSSAAIFPGSGANAVVGRLSTADPDDMIANYSLVAGEGSTDNAEFNISAATLRVNNPAALTRGTYSVRIQADDTFTGGTYAKVFKLFVAAPGERAVVSLAAGFYTRYATSDGTLWGVGPAFDFLPVRIAQGVAMVPQGLQHGEMYLKKDGTLWSAGGNFPGEPSLTPVPVATDVASVAVGGNVFLSFDGPPPPDNLRTMFVKKDGTLWGVGGNDHGQLGDGTTIKRLTPVQVATGVASVSAGSEHTHFVKTDGSLWAMGANSVGQLGDGTTTDRSTPVQIATGVASVSAGGGHTVFVKIDGTLWAMGAGGVLGDGTAVSRNTPVPITSGVANASAGRSHTVFVKNDGTMWSVGSNSLGQLGDGTNTDRVAPVQVATDVAFASAGLTHSAFVKSNGSVWKVGPGGTVNPQNLVPVPTTEAWIGAQAPSQSAAPDRSATFAIAVGGVQNPTYEWQRNGVTVATSSPLQLSGVKPADAGIYSAKTSGGAAFSEPAIFGLTSNTKVVGTATEIQADIFVAVNGNTIDQVLLQGAAAAITADHALRQITRVSFVDLSNDIVQVEFSGPGTLSLVLDNPTGPATAASYNQPGVVYMKGHAGIVITGATEETNVSVFSVGRATAVNHGLFRSDVTYDGVADIAYIAIMSSNGKFGGVRTANASYFATKGLTGLYAPGVQFTGPVFIGDISASDEATPVVIVGSVADARVTGGDLLQANGHPVKVDGLAQLKFTAGSDSHGNALSAKANRAILQQTGVDVTSQVVVGP